MLAEGSSGPWRGHYTYFEIPTPHPLSFQLTRTPDGLEGAGSDDVGEFTLAGEPGTQPGSWSIRKQYLGRHEIRLEASEIAGGMVGRWFLEGTCGGAFAFWPGTSETPSPEVLGEVPKVELLPSGIRKRLALLDWAFLGVGLLGLVVYAALPVTGKNYPIAFLAFGAYVWLSTVFQKWLVRRILRLRLGGFGSLADSIRIGAPIGWLRQVTTGTILATILTVACMLAALWFFHRKR